jgi:putative endonuclease
MKKYFVYILANRVHGTLYIGVTSGLLKRIYQHKHDLTSGFSKKYKTHLLVYYEVCDDVYVAITREKQIKKWKRAWKIKLIESINPEWKDLYENLF